MVTSDNVPTSLPCRHLARADIRAKLKYCLDCEGGGVPVESIDAAGVSERPRGVELIVAGDLNVDLER